MLPDYLSEILFIDIETVSQVRDYESLPERFKHAWEKKAKIIAKDSTPNDVYFEKSAIFAEYGKVVVIGMGLIHKHNGEDKLRIKAFASDNEHELLSMFVNFLSDHKNIKRLCAHNGREFDFPYLCRRLLINKIKIPSILNFSNLKPWEIPHLDTLDMWKFGDWKNYTSLETLATVFDIPTSKDGIDGSQVNDYYYNKKGLEQISLYCKKDVLVLAQVYLNLIQQQPIDDKNVTIL